MSKKLLAENETELRIPWNLQFFGEGNDNPDDDDDADGDIDNETGEVDKPEDEPELDPEERIQSMMVEMEKIKRAQEKAAREAADYKKKYNSKLTETEKASQEKAEAEAARQEEFDSMKRKIAITDYANNFMDIGYPKALADKAAIAQFDGDNESVIKFQKEFLEARVKQERADWLKSRPMPQSGMGGEDGENKDAFLAGFNS